MLHRPLRNWQLVVTTSYQGEDGGVEYPHVLDFSLVCPSLRFAVDWNSACTLHLLRGGVLLHVCVCVSLCVFAHRGERAFRNKHH